MPPLPTRLAAALFAVLLPFGVLGEEAGAQEIERPSTITTTAEASWTFAGQRFSISSNQVAIHVVAPPPSIKTFRANSLADYRLTYAPPQCGDGKPNTGAPPTNSPPDAPTGPVSTIVEQTQAIRPGQALLFEVSAIAGNKDPQAIDKLDLLITSSTGDRETITVFETAANSGHFAGSIDTFATPPGPVANDCRLAVARDAKVAFAASLNGDTISFASAEVNILADPFGVVFDSETGTPISGATVTMVDDTTGMPAQVFAEDGVTTWPSTVVTGQPITDGAGRVVQIPAGEYWFPLAAFGRYRITITPPAPYTAPSKVSRAGLDSMRRPDGRAFIISDASFGGTFALIDTTPLQIDIPVDQPGKAVNLVKTVSRQQAEPGDTVFYTLTVRNEDAARTKRNLTLVDNPSPHLRLRPGSIRIDGAADEHSVTVAPDGSSFTVALGDLEGGALRRITYAMTVRPDAPPGRVLNEALVSDSLGRVSRASAALDVLRDSIAGRMTIIGRVTEGGCLPGETPRGLPGVRVMLEDGSFAITDADGAYHFDAVAPGTHVVQVARMTLPEGGTFIDCTSSTRSAGSAISRFVTGGGGALAVADFHASVPQRALTTSAVHRDAATSPGAEPPAPGPATDWLALGDGPDGWLAPTPDANPRAPAIRVAIRHRKGQRVVLRVDGEEVDPLAYDGTLTPEAGRFAVSTWRGVHLRNERTLLEADIYNSFGEIGQTISREVFFTTTPTHVELVPELSNLVADGRTRPVVAIRVLDRNGRPLREGIAGEFRLSAPYESAEQLDRQQLDRLTGLSASAARWVVEGEEGIARIELAPTMVSGALKLDFTFDDGQIVRQQELEAWFEPGDIDWTIIGLAEGTAGARSVADNMERAGTFDSDLGDDARVALYVKGRVLGRYLLTLAYDSAKQEEDQRLLGTIDPAAYYTVFGDSSLRRFDAASREKLYVRIESATFHALFGDFETGFDQTQLGRYNRTATGLRGEARFGQVGLQGFAAEVASRLQRVEIQGQGISGPYQLGSRTILANSEKVVLEVRDRFRSELIVSRRELTRFSEYDIDLLTGTITFAEPVLSRDPELNPQFIVVEFETTGDGPSELNAGLRADWTSADGQVRIGASALTDKGDGSRTDMGVVDLHARFGTASEVRAEFGTSRRDGDVSTGWLVETQHQTGKLDVLAYARQLDADYGIGEQNGAELGRRKFGIDGRLLLNEHLSLLTSLWQDESLADATRRRTAQTQLQLTRQSTDLRLGFAHFDDRLADGAHQKSTVIEGGVTQRLFGNDLELSANTSVALGEAASVDLPARHRLGLRYRITDAVRLVGTYELANGEQVDTRTLRGGFDLTPWRGGQIVTTLGRETLASLGNRNFAAFGLAQSVQLTKELTIDATVDGNRSLGGSLTAPDVVNPEHPLAIGGQLTGGLVSEDFTAVTFGGAWRKDRWSVTARGEWRDGEEADRRGASFGAIRQLGEGSMVGSGATWTYSLTPAGAATEIIDASLAFAHRPSGSAFAMLSKLQFRSDEIAGAVGGSVGAAGSTALTADGNALSRRLVASWSGNLSPRSFRLDEQGISRSTRRDEFALFIGGRYSFDRFEGEGYTGSTVLVGADARIGISEAIDIGASANIRTSFDDKVTSFAVGPTISASPVDGMVFTLGYNIEGFRDEDFGEARNTQKGVFASIKFKFDTDSFSFLGLGR